MALYGLLIPAPKQNAVSSIFTVTLIFFQIMTTYNKNSLSRRLAYPAVVVFLAIVIFAIYSQVFNGEFVLDDYSSIVHNESIKSTDIKQFFNQSRPLGRYSFALNYSIHGFEPFGYHLVNIILHVLNSILVFFLVQALFATPKMAKSRLAEHSVSIAFFTALIFAVHPVQTQAVSYITQRLESLSSTFFLAALICYVRASLKIHSGKVNSISIVYALGFVVFFVISLFTKESMMTLIAVVPVTEFLFFTYDRKKALFFGATGILTLLIFLGVFSYLYDAGDIYQRISGDTFIEKIDSITRETDEISRTDYALTQINVVRKYISLLFIPVNQNLDYAYPVFTSLFNTATIISLILIIAFIVLAVFVSGKHRMALYGILFFLITLIPTSSFFPIRDVINEHRIYLSSVGFILTFVVCYQIVTIYLVNSGAVKKIGKLSSSLQRAVSRIGYKDVIVLFVLSNILAFGTFKRNFAWVSEENMWKDVIVKSPRNWRAHANLSEVYRRQGLYDNQAIELHKVISFGGGRDEIKYYSYNLASYYFARNDLENAQYYFENTLNIDSEFAEAHYFMGMIRLGENQILDALKSFNISLNARRYTSLPVENIWLQLGLGNYMILKDNNMQKAYDNVSAQQLSDFMGMHAAEAQKYLNLAINQERIFVDRDVLAQYLNDIAGLGLDGR